MTRWATYRDEGGSRLDRIKLYARDGVTTLTLPRCRPTLSYEDETISAKMASKIIVEDVIGVRPVYTATYGYLPAADLIALNRLVLEGGFHRAVLPGVEGDVDAWFKIEPPSYEVFKYVKGEPMWSNVTLKLTAREVVRG